MGFSGSMCLRKGSGCETTGWQAGARSEPLKGIHKVACVCVCGRACVRMSVQVGITADATIATWKIRTQNDVVRCVFIFSWILLCFCCRILQVISRMIISCFHNTACVFLTTGLKPTLNTLAQCPTSKCLQPLLKSSKRAPCH